MIFKTLLARENWETKYRFKDETPLQTFQRVTQSLAEVEKKYGATEEEVTAYADKFLKTIVNFKTCEDDQYVGQDLYVDIEGNRLIADGLKCTTGGRITANAGTSFDKATLLNCFINSPVSNSDIVYKKRVPNTEELIECDLRSEQTPDNLTNIFLSLLEAAETLKSEGGYGANFGFIRPRGCLIEGVGIRHPGVVSYMELWDKMSAMIVKGDNDGYSDKLEDHLEDSTFDRVEKVMPRKGAMLAALPIWHPDIEEFVRAKQESGKLTKFNISVLIDDEFMEAVENDDLYDLHFEGKTYKKVRAVELYDLIMESTYNRAEPGVLFFDNMNRQNPLVYLGPVSASNPCVAEGTLVATEKGLVPVESVEVGHVIQTTQGFDPVEKIEVHENYPVSKVEFSDGTTLRVTEGHIFHIWDSVLKEWDTSTRLSDISSKNIEEGVFVRKDSYRFEGSEHLETFPSRKVKIESVTPDGKTTVYDLYEPKADDWNTHGIVSRGCGEIPGTSFVDKGYKPKPYLKPYMEDWNDHHIGFTTVCLLGSVNLTQYVRPDRTFDFKQYREDIDTFARMLENVNDIGKVPLPAYEWALKNIRQYGMGVNGLGSSHFMLGLTYGSADGNEFVKEIQQIKDDQTMRTSALLAKERGPFPMYDDCYVETPYFKDYCTASEETKDLVRKYGLRNAKRLTNPPLGNSSIICDNVSNGIEPVFSFGYERTFIADKWPQDLTRKNIKDHLEKIKVGGTTAWRGEFQGRTYHYEPQNRGLCLVQKVEDYGYAWLHEHYPGDIDRNASYLVTAQDLAVQDHVDVQERVQKSCDQSVSKCLVKGQLVETSEGPMKIDEIMDGTYDEEGFYPAKDCSVYDQNGKLVSVKRSYYGGEKPCYRIRTESGDVVECSDQHRFLTPKGWVKAEDLSEQSFILRSDMDYQHSEGRKDLLFDVDELNLHYYKDVKIPEKMSPLFAELLGMIASDGDMNRNYFRLTEKDSVVGERFKEICFELFGYTTGVNVDKRNGVRSHRVCSTPLALLIKHLLKGDNSFTKQVPDQIIFGSKEEKLRFLSGVSLDGYYLSNKNSFCLYAGTSEKLAEGIHIIARQLWGNSVYKASKNTVTGNFCYLVCINRSEGFTPIDPHKIKAIQDITFRNNLVSIDPDHIDDLSYNYKDSNYNSFRSLRTRKPSIVRKKVADRHGIDYEDGVKISSIEFLGKREVFDIEVDSEDHTYLVEGLISHNTANLPSDYPFEDFKDLYIKAWKADLVGFTTYRDGTMENVLAVSSDDDSSESEDFITLLRSFDALKEDAEITEDGVIVKHVNLPNKFSNGNTVKVKADGNKYYFHMSYLPDDNQFPIALWAYTNDLQDGEYVSLNRGVRAITNLLLDRGIDEQLVKGQARKTKEDPHHTRLAKAISMALRHNVGVLPIVHALTDIEGDYIASTLSAMRKFLSTHVKDGTKIQGVTCPDCGSTDIVFESGCSTCRSCGNSKCGS